MFGLTDRITAIGASAAALVFAAGMAWQTFQLHGVRGDLKEAKAALVAVKADLRTCQSNRVALVASIDAQNRAVEAIRREGEARVAESRKSERAARAVAESARREADRVLAMQSRGELCVDAVSVLRGEGS